MPCYMSTGQDLPVLAALIPVHPVAQAVAAVALAHPATVVALAVAAVARAQADLRIPAVAVFVPGTRVAQPALGPCLSTAGWAVPGHARCADTGRVLAVIADERGYARFVALIARCRCRDHDCSHSFMHGTQSMRYPPSSWHSRRLTQTAPHSSHVPHLAAMIVTVLSLYMLHRGPAPRCRPQCAPCT